MVQIGPSGSETTTATIDAAGLAALEHTSVSQEAATVPTVTTMQNAAVANGNGTSLVVTGYATALLQATSSPSMSGGTTVNFEGSADGGTTWVSVVAHQLGTSGSQITTATADADFRINCAGLSHLRARISAYSAGTVTIKGYASPLAGAGTAVSISNIVGVSSTDGANVTIGAMADAAALTGTVSVAALLKGIAQAIKAEDAAHVSGDFGVPSWGVRKDTAAATAADGDYQPPIFDATGRQWVNTELPDAVTPADDMSNATQMPEILARLMGFDGTTWDRLRAVGGALQVAPLSSSLVGDASASALYWMLRDNGSGSQSVGAAAVHPIVWNGSSADRQRNNTDTTILTSAARTATTNGADQTNFNGRGVIVVLNVTAQPGGVETLTVTIQGKESVSGSYFDIETSGILFTAATGTKALIVYPGVLAADIVAGVVGKSGVVPRTWRPSIVHSSSGSWTYSVSAVTLT